VNHDQAAVRDAAAARPATDAADAATDGTQLTIRNVLPNVRRLLWLTGIDQVLTITTP
jgi:anti-anti-sigma regulatory factor